MRKAKVYYKNDLAGILTETDNGYEFQYFLYLKNHIYPPSCFRSSTD